MNVIEALEAIEAAPRGGARIAEICRLVTSTSGVRLMFTDTLDAFITFGVQKLPERGPVAAQVMTDAEWFTAVTTLGARLARRELTGDAAQQVIQAFLTDCNDLQFKWGSRYLKRDLRLDTGAKALNKVLGKDFVPLFEVPLAEPHTGVKPKIFTEGSWVWQPKLDGARCVAFIDGDGKVVLKSRTGKVWKNFESVRLAIETAARDANLTNYVFDGEVVSLDADGYIDFQALQKTMQRRDGVEIGTLVFAIFDAASASEWQRPQLMYAERYAGIGIALLGAEFGASRLGEDIGAESTYGIRAWGPGGRLIRVPQQDYDSQDFMTVCKFYVDRGYEGGMLRRTDVPVIMKRSRALIKVKTFMEGEGVCIGLTEGEGNRAGKMGALVLQWKPGLTCKCGSGLSSAKLAELTADPPIGKKVTVKYFEETNDGVPRFPIFKCVRVAEDVPEDENEE